MRNYLWIISVIALFAISGCGGQVSSFQEDTFSDIDKCIVSIQNSKALCYGDSKADIEEIIQSTGESWHTFVMYPSGLRVAYRDDVAVGFQLFKGSEKVYQTARGARIGMSKDEIMHLYGSKYAHEATSNHLDYAYDMETGKFVEKSLLFSTEVQMKRKKIFLISAMFDADQGDTHSQITIMDQKMAIFLE